MASELLDIFGSGAKTIETAAPETAAPESVVDETVAPEAVIPEVKTEESVKIETTEIKTEEFNPLKWINEKFEKKFENEDQIKEFFEKPYSEDLKENLKKEIESQYQSELNSYKEALEQRDALKILGEDGYKDFMIRQKLGDKVNANMIKDVISGKIDGMDDLSRAAAMIMFKNKNISPKAAVDLVKKQVGIDPEETSPEITHIQWAEIALKAQDADEYFEKIKNIEIPEIKNLEDQKKQTEEQKNKIISSLKESWKPQIDKFFEDFKSIGAKESEKIAELKDFKFDIGVEEKKQLREAAEQIVVNKGIEVNEKNVKEVFDTLVNRYEEVNKDKIALAKLKHLYDALTEKHHKDVHNEAEVNKSVNPGKVKAGSAEEIQLKSFLGSGLI